MTRTIGRRGGALALLLATALLGACSAGDAPPGGVAAHGPAGSGPSDDDGTPVEDPVGFDRTDGLAGPTPTPTPATPPGTPPASAPTPVPTPTTDRTHPIALTWEGMDLRLPSSRTELVGFHESNHDGARDLQAYEGRVAAVVLPSRGRGTAPRGASDIVVHPTTELRAPISGTVLRAGTYTLYCDELDDFVVIEPTGRTGIEVKLLHIDGVRVTAGDVVEAGVTVLAPRPTPLPFRSQVDDVSGPDDWPHVHLEVVDTTIPDRPNENSGSDDC